MSAANATRANELTAVVRTNSQVGRPSSGKLRERTRVEAQNEPEPDSRNEPEPDLQNETKPGPQNESEPKWVLNQDVDAGHQTPR
jgi:hypothetical protein